MRGTLISAIFMVPVWTDKVHPRFDSRKSGCRQDHERESHKEWWHFEQHSHSDRRNGGGSRQP